MSKKKRASLIALSIIAVLIMVISISYAYFTSVISGESNPNVITSGTMRLEFSDGPAISLSDALPGDSVTKTFSVENTGTVETKYDIYFSELCNIFVDKTDLVYTLRHTSTNGYELLTETEVPSTSSKIIDSQSIAPNETQTYEITIKFLSKDENQDDNQGAYFSTKLNINDYKGALHCSKYNNTVKYYVNNKEVQDIPNNIGYLYSTSNCTNNATITWDTENWNYAVDYDSSTADSVCSINFIPEVYTITYNLDGGTNSSSNPSSYTIETDTITLSNPTKEGYTFNGWTGDDTTIPKGSTGNKIYTASFTPIAHIITIKAGTGGSVSVKQGSTAITTVAAGKTGTFTGTEGVTYTLTATPTSGYKFSKWSDNTTAASKTITVGTSDATYSATFAVSSYTLAIGTLSNGVVTDWDNNIYTGGTYSTNKTVEIKAVANSGYHFTQWSDGETSPIRKVTMNSNKTLTPTFASGENTLKTVTSTNPTNGNDLPKKSGDVTIINGYALGKELGYKYAPDEMSRGEYANREVSTGLKVTDDIEDTAYFIYAINDTAGTNDSTTKSVAANLNTAAMKQWYKQFNIKNKYYYGATRDDTHWKVGSHYVFGGPFYGVDLGYPVTATYAQTKTTYKQEDNGNPAFYGWYMVHFFLKNSSQVSSSDEEYWDSFNYDYINKTIWNKPITDLTKVYFAVVCCKPES